MSQIPQDDALDSSLAFRREGYEFFRGFVIHVTRLH
jgi:hypothetical protein